VERGALLSVVIGDATVLQPLQRMHRLVCKTQFVSQILDEIHEDLGVYGRMTLAKGEERIDRDPIASKFALGNDMARTLLPWASPN
jgi:hypothetical protein